MVEESAITCRYALATASTTRSRLLLYEFWEAFRRSFKTLRLEFCPKSKSVKRTPEGFPEFVQKQPRSGGAGGGQCVPAGNSRFLDDRISASAIKYLPGPVPAGSRSESCGSSGAH